MAEDGDKEAEKEREESSESVLQWMGIDFQKWKVKPVVNIVLSHVYHLLRRSLGLIQLFYQNIQNVVLTSQIGLNTVQ